MRVVGIAGVTCSGKTSLAKMLLDKIPESIHICMDTYFKPEDHPDQVLVPNLGHKNWELITSIDIEAMERDIIEIINKSKNQENDLKLLIVEGFLVLNESKIRKYCDSKFFVDLNYDECWRRRQTRSYDPPDIPGYFQQVVWPEAVKNREILCQMQDVVLLEGQNSLDENLNKIMELSKL